MAGRSCCVEHCLENAFTYDSRINFISNCLKDVQHLNRSERKDYITERISNSIVPLNSNHKQNYSYSWTVGKAPGPVRVVCKNAFMLCYNIGHTYIQVITF